MELKTFIAPLRKWWWLVLAATLVAGGSSYHSASKQPPIYQSRATLMVGRIIDNPNPSSNDFSVGQQLAATYVNIANTQLMRRRTAEALGLDRLPEYVVQPLPGTQLIAVTVTDTSPERTQAVADELARQLVLQSPTAPTLEEQELQAFIEGQLTDLQADIQATEGEIAAWQDILRDAISARELDEAETQVAALQTKLNTLQSIFATLLSTTERGANNTVRIIDPAFLPAMPIGPRVGVTVLTAAAVGFVLAASAAYVLEYLDDTVKSGGEVERICGLPTLGGINRIKLEDSQSKVIAIGDPRSPVAEAFRALGTGIQFSNPDEANRTLLISSANPTEGKSMVAANLAAVLAQANNNVLLIDADLHRPDQHRIFSLNNEHGLSTLLHPLFSQTDISSRGELERDFAPVEKYIQNTSQPRLSILASGPLPMSPSELFNSSKMKAILSCVSAKFDYVILDSPPILPVTDATILSTMADSVIVLVDVGQTRRKALRKAVGRLREVHANLAGVILNRIPVTSEDYYHYGSYYREPTSDHRRRPGGLGEDSVAPNGKANSLLGKLRRKQSI